LVADCAVAPKNVKNENIIATRRFFI